MDIANPKHFGYFDLFISLIFLCFIVVYSFMKCPELLCSTWHAVAVCTAYVQEIRIGKH
jgi:hypothetical protein